MAQDDLWGGVRPEYPFSAFVGNDRAKGAIECALSSPDISSVLICGPRGTGKSVLARSIATVAGGRRVVNLPLNASEDQVFGGMDLEASLRDGRRRMSDSLISRADGNVLLVENINLVPMSMAFQVLNAAETGMSIVERDGVSGINECSFLVVATMDAEEGSIPNHVLDRFDICVFLSNSEDEVTREEIVSRRMRYEDDPFAFIAEFADQDAEVSARISRARSRVRFTRVPDGYLEAISEVCERFRVSGHRGDIAVMNAACSLAALDGRDTANLEDLKEAAAICLEHRRNDPETDENPQEPSEPQEDDGDDGEDGQTDDGRNDNDQEPQRQDDGQDDGQDADDQVPPPPAPETREEVFDIGDVYKVIDYLPEEGRELTKARAGRHSKSHSEDSTGRCIGYRIPRGRIQDIALTASIRAAAPYQVMRDHGDLAIVLKREDLREKVREKRQGNNILFLVDGSGSIGAQRRMVAVKGAILSMLKDAYQKRDSIGMAVFRTDRAEEVLPLTRSTLKAYKVLADIPTGGRTPLTHGLIKGHEILKDYTRGQRPVMVILSDGRCNVSYTPGRRPVDEMLSTAAALADSGIRFIVIDTEVGRLRFGLALDLCRALNGTYLRLEDLNAEYIERSVRMAIDF